ncbi:MAG: hypothetical protein J5495_06305, partial [Bacteroidales bacterium]|nr:hypothetical protein [Bacteroidales bacterium]
LVDERGGLVDAIRYAETLAGLESGKYRIAEYPATETTYEKLMKGISGVKAGAETAAKMASDPLYPIEAAYSKLREKDFTVLARLPWIYEFR